MFISKHLIDSILRKIAELERRVKRLELLELEGAKNKIASLSNERTGSISKDGISTIEEIIKESIDV